MVHSVRCESSEQIPGLSIQSVYDFSLLLLAPGIQVKQQQRGKTEVYLNLALKPWLSGSRTGDL